MTAYEIPPKSVRTESAEVVLSRVLARCGFAFGHETTEDEAVSAIEAALSVQSNPYAHIRPEHTDQEIWTRFFSSFAASGDDADSCARYADKALESYRRRFSV